MLEKYPRCRIMQSGDAGGRCGGFDVGTDGRTGRERHTGSIWRYWRALESGGASACQTRHRTESKLGCSLPT